MYLVCVEYKKFNNYFICSVPMLYNCMYQGCDLTTVKNPEKWVAGLGLPLVKRTPEPSWMFNFGGFTYSPHPRKQDLRGLDIIQAISFFPWWLLLFLQEHLVKILKSGKILNKITGLIYT